MHASVEYLLKEMLIFTKYTNTVTTIALMQTQDGDGGREGAREGRGGIRVPVGRN